MAIAGVRKKDTVGARATRLGTGCLRWLGFAALALIAMPAVAAPGDWPTYRHDAARSGITQESVDMPLAERWVYVPQYGPVTAWGEPNPRPVGGWYGATEQRRVQFDDAFQVAVAGGAVYFGSSADGKIYSLDLKTGQPRWSVRTGGPIRLAPTVWEDRVYAGSDDGLVYCLAADDGSRQWTFHAAPRNHKLLGSGKMISLWPVRTGVLIDDDVAYFGAGIFPSEGVYMYAVDADDGNLIWCNDTCGSTPQSRVSFQGYLLASPSHLFSPLGRVSPAAFDRKSGRLLYQSYIEHVIGRTLATLADNQLFTGTEQMIGYDEASYRSRSSWFWGHRLVVTPDNFYTATGDELFAVQRKLYGTASLQRKRLLDQKRDLNRKIAQARRGPETQRKALAAQMDVLNEKIKQVDADIAAGQLWRVPCKCSESLILAGDVLLAGGEGIVQAFDAMTGKCLWPGHIEGKARGLAVADG